MKPAAFAYVGATSVAEAVAALTEHGYDAKLIAGGQSLMPLLNFRLSRPAVLVDINRAKELSFIRQEGGYVSIGALTRHREVELSPVLRAVCPLISDAASHIGHVSIRNRGTLGGTIAHADPAAEMPAIAVATGAEFVLTGAAGSRTVPAEEFFIALYTTAMQPDELLTEVRIPTPDPRSGHAFLEIARRHGDFALAGVACILTPDAARPERIAGARIALMGVGDVPLRARAAEEALVGQEAGAEAFKAAVSAALSEIDPPADLHATATYRRHMTGVLTLRALDQAWTEAQRRMPR